MTVGKHATPWHKSIADAGTILRTEIGSGVHGTSVSGGYDDRDEMGICIEDPVTLFGLKTFEQYEYHTAWERPGGLRERSGHGDLDETVYSLHKWMRLALNGNPSILVPLFAPQSAVVAEDAHGMLLRSPGVRAKIVSKVAGKRFAGYLHAQRRSMLSHDHPSKGRDVTGHMLRLGYQGIELMKTGRITLPMPEDERAVVMAARQGEISMQRCLDLAESMEVTLNSLVSAELPSPLPEQPDHAWTDTFLRDTYLSVWEEKGWSW